MAEDFEIVIETKLTGTLARRLVEEADKRSIEPVALLASIVELVLADGLIEAVLG